MDKKKQIAELIQPISDDLLSGAAEIALKAIFIYQTVMNMEPNADLTTLKADIYETARALVECQPAMAPLFHLSNKVLFATQQTNSPDELRKSCQDALDEFERNLCESVGKIAELVYDLIPPGEMVFAYSFSSTVVSCLLNARARGRYFRVACSESRPSWEGRKLSTRLASGGIEVIHTFDSAMGIVLPTCSVAFMGCDCVGAPGLVNKVGSLLLALSCQEMGIPLYALCGTEKFVTDERLFEFENHERPGSEVWSDPPKGVKVVNRQFELIPTKLLTGLVTEDGILKEQDIAQHLLSQTPVHEALRLEPAGF
jgi:translation initiation factor 2B subunit (eIF-2B alpha/beta/delta family)